MLVENAIKPTPIQNKLIIQEKWDFVKDCFVKREQETSKHYFKRAGKNSVVTALMLAAIGAAFYALPILIAIPLILTVGSAAANADKIKKQVKKVVTTPKYAVISLLFATALIAIGCTTPLSLFIPLATLGVTLGVLVKKMDINTFKKKKDESKKHYALRMGMVAIGIAAIASVCALIPTIAAQLGNLKGGWPTLSASKALILCEYFTVGLIHFLDSARLMMKKQYGKACIHLVFGLMSFLCPVMRLFNCHDAGRLHHDMIGLLLGLLPSYSFQLLGGAYVGDSMLYNIKPGRDQNYDFSNVVVDNFQWVVFATWMAALLQFIFASPSKERKELPDRCRPHFEKPFELFHK